MKTIKAWHFLQDDKRLGFKDGRQVRLGEWVAYKGELSLCNSGLHASRKILDALGYARGSIICRVEEGGKILEDTDKMVAERRRVLWWVDGKELLRDFARRCALDVIHLWNAPDVVVQYLKTGDESIRGAAYSAASSAAHSAVHSAAAWAATWAADRAASNAAYKAAHNAAYSAASSAAHRAATWAATWAADRAAHKAARKKQERRLLGMVNTARRSTTACPT